MIVDPAGAVLLEHPPLDLPFIILPQLLISIAEHTNMPNRKTDMSFVLLMVGLIVLPSFPKLLSLSLNGFLPYDPGRNENQQLSLALA